MVAQDFTTMSDPSKRRPQSPMILGFQSIFFSNIYLIKWGVYNLNPGRLTWNLPISHLEIKENDLPNIRDSIFRDVNANDSGEEEEEQRAKMAKAANRNNL